MRVALLNAPSAETYGPIKSASGRYFPLGLGYIAAVLARAGHQVLFLDPETQGLREDGVAARLASFEPGLIGVSSATPSYPSACRLAAVARRAVPGSTIVAGGVHVSAIPADALNEGPEFDLAVRGEGEVTMLDLARVLEKASPTPDVLREVAGITFREREGVRANPDRDWIRDLDSLPFPARHLVDFDAYVPHAHNRRGRRATTAITSRGCPHGCLFCASKVVLGRAFRPHSPEYVVEEISHLVGRFGVDQIIFNDDTFTFDRDRDLAICELIRKRGLKIAWFCFARIDTVSRDILKAMRDAGCFSVGFGIESADAGILRNLRKTISIERAREVLSWCDELRIKSQCFFVFGCPGETRATAEATMRLAAEMNPALAFFNMMVPYPGTEAYSRLEPELRGGQRARRWEDWVAIGPRSTITVPGIPSLERLVAEANMRFYFRPRQILKMLGYASNFTELRQLLRGALALVSQLFRWRV